MDKITKRAMKTGKQLMLQMRPYQLPVLLLLVAIVATVGIKAVYHPHAATTPASQVAGAAANKIIFWGSPRNCTDISDSDVDYWKANGGLGGVGCETQYLDGLGGSERFQATPVSGPGGGYDEQYYFQLTNIPTKFTAKGLDTYMLFYTSNLNHLSPGSTPFFDWFDDADWNNVALPSIQRFAAAAKMLGFTGIGMDHESHGDEQWWNYTGNTHTEQQTRDEVYKRGQQVMQAILAVYPNCKFINYGQQFSGSWGEKVQNVLNGQPPDGNKKLVWVDFWDGMLSQYNYNGGYGDIYMGDFTFYKSFNVGPSWDNAMQYDLNGTYANFSQNMRSWSVPSSERVNVTPMVAVSPVDQYPQNNAAATAVQLDRARYWGTGGTFINYTYDLGHGFPADFQPPRIPNWFNDGGGNSYLPGLAAAAQPGTVDTTPPTLSSVTQNQSGGNSIISGIAHDNSAVRSVSWSTPSANGMATMIYNPTYSSPGVVQSWQMNWTFTAPISSGTTVTITAEDTKGNKTNSNVVVGGGPVDNPPTVSLSANPTTVTQGSATTLTATASDSDPTPVAKVEFYDGATLLGTDTAAPYNFTWTTSNSTSTGGHSLTAKAYDTANLSATSAIATVTVNPASGGGGTTTTLNDNTTGTGINQFNYSGSPGTWTYDTTNCASIAYSGDCHYNSTDGSYYQLAFNGTGVNIFSFKAPDEGNEDFYIDGTRVGSADLYSANVSPTGSSPVFSITSLANGAHTLKVVGNGKDPNSAGFGPIADRVDIISSSASGKPGDVNGDGRVNITDLSILTAHFGQSGQNLSTGDLNGDGKVNILDLSILASHWGT